MATGITPSGADPFISFKTQVVHTNPNLLAIIKLLPENPTSFNFTEETGVFRLTYATEQTSTIKNDDSTLDSKLAGSTLKVGREVKGRIVPSVDNSDPKIEFTSGVTVTNDSIAGVALGAIALTSAAFNDANNTFIVKATPMGFIAKRTIGEQSKPVALQAIMETHVAFKAI